MTLRRPDRPMPRSRRTAAITFGAALALTGILGACGSSVVSTTTNAGAVATAAHKKHKTGGNGASTTPTAEPTTTTTVISPVATPALGGTSSSSSSSSTTSTTVKPTTTTTVPGAAPPPPPPAIPPLPKNCPGVTSPPSAPYAVTVSGTITGVLTITKNGNNNLPSEAAIAASYCGTLAVPAETGTVLSVDIKFAKTTLYVGYSRNKKGDPVGISDYGLVLSADGPIDATVIRSASPSGAAANGGLELSLTSQIETTIVVSPTILCNDGPVALDLSTQNPGGASLTGPLSAASAVTAQDGFTIPAVVEGQKSCQFGSIDFADPINETVALPATDTLTAQNITLSAKD